ncbi:hypothetical protein PanWU01x14_217890, partial [Parasponia andersonii]
LKTRGGFVATQQCHVALQLRTRPRGLRSHVTLVSQATRPRKGAIGRTTLLRSLMWLCKLVA